MSSRSTRRRSVLVLLLSHSLFAGLMAGCRAEPKPGPPPPPPPASMSDVERVQSNLQVHDRNARAGLVVKVSAADNNAAIQLASAGSSTMTIKDGDVFTITDSRQEPIANGSVIYQDGSVYVINYVVSERGRAPLQGDIAIHMSER